MNEWTFGWYGLKIKKKSHKQLKMDEWMDIINGSMDAIWMDGWMMSKHVYTNNWRCMYGWMNSMNGSMDAIWMDGWCVDKSPKTIEDGWIYVWMNE